MKVQPEHYFETVLDKTEFIVEERAVDGADAQQSIFAYSFGGLLAPKAAAPSNIEITLDCTLDEFYNGSVKQFDYDRNVVQHDAKTVKSAHCN